MTPISGALAPAASQKVSRDPPRLVFGEELRRERASTRTQYSRFYIRKVLLLDLPNASNPPRRLCGQNF
jgi:hypothetical protein